MLDKKKTLDSHTLETTVKTVAREGDRKRKTDARRMEQLETYSAAIRAPEKAIKKDRRRKRKTVADIQVPQKQRNMSAMRFVLRVSDIFWITAVIAVAVWNAYIGINNKNIIAPVAAALLGMSVFISMLFLNKAHRFAPVSYTHLTLPTIYSV